MRFLTFEHEGKTSPGILSGDIVVDIGAALFELCVVNRHMRDLGAFLEAGGMKLLEGTNLFEPCNSNRFVIPVENVRIRAPILRPPKITALGMNYRDHAAEQNIAPPEKPLLFAKAANSVIGPDEAIAIPKGSTKTDYEVELAVVIGRPGHLIPANRALEHVFGFTVMNDVSEREAQFGDKQWYRGKSFATFAPMGPVVVTPDELDCSDLGISLKLNGKVMQDSRTSQLIFKMPELIEYISAVYALEAGDVIATGTPGGVGVFRKPQVFLKAGDVVEATIEGIGTLRNAVAGDVHV
jgi:2-keto-4-pentenoate hydratase/2-oxohepta-3-ene-1,7-dioic acid hydratase in catechol pathway